MEDEYTMKKKSRCIQCVIRFLEIDCAALDRLKEISFIFDLDPSNLDRQFITAKGITIKEFFENKKNEKFLSLLQNNQHYGYQMGRELGFKTDYAFYHWVKRVYGISYKELLKQHHQISLPDSRPGGRTSKTINQK